MKQLGKYDDAMIVITADHGSLEHLVDEQGNTVQATIPILFVKEPQEQNEELVISEAPVCHADIIPTIRKNMGMSITEKTLSEYVEGEERIRTFKLVDTNTYERWQVSGNVREYDSWQFIKSEKLKN